MPIFSETQRPRQSWLFLVIVLLTLMGWVLFVQQIVRGKPFGDNPLPDWGAILWAIVSICVIFMLRRTTLGANIYAIGNNVKAAYLSGVPVQRTLVICYALSGFFAGLAALLLTGYSNQSYFRMGDPYVLPSIAAVVVGGTSILGGSGGYLGTIAGAIIITLLTNLLSIENRPRADQQILFGLIVLTMLLIYGRERKARQ